MDPNYEGQLYVGLYNFSSKNFLLRPGKTLIGGIFIQLNEDVASKKKKMKKDQFPEDLVEMIEKYSPVNTQSLVSKMESVEKKITHMQTVLDEKLNWQKTIQESIDKLVVGLEKEIQNRKENTNTLQADIDRLRTENTTYKQTKSSFIQNTIGVIGILVAIGLGVLAYIF